MDCQSYEIGYVQLDELQLVSWFLQILVQIHFLLVCSYFLLITCSS